MAFYLDLAVERETSRLVRARAPHTAIGHQPTPYLALLHRRPPIGNGDLRIAYSLHHRRAGAGARQVVAGLPLHWASRQEICERAIECLRRVYADVCARVVKGRHGEWNLWV